jgi:ionotropic kainate glutamate receptor 2
MMILTAMYTAHLTTNLTVESPGKIVRSLEELNKGEHNFEWGVSVNSYIVKEKRKSEYELYKDIYEKSIKFDNFRQALNRTKQGNFILIDSKADLEWSFMDDCKKVIVYTSAFEYDWSLGMPLNAPHSEVINRLFIAYREEGLFTMIFDKWHKSDGKCEASSQSHGGEEKYKFTPAILAGLFLILFCGILWAIITSCLEFLYASYLDSKENGEATYQCFCKRISLKKREIVEEWFGKFSEEKKEFGDEKILRDEEILRKYKSSRAALNKSPTESGTFVLKQQVS